MRVCVRVRVVEGRRGGRGWVGVGGGVRVFKSGFVCVDVQATTLIFST